MSICQIEERDAGRPYPRTCPTCGLSKPCARGLDRASLKTDPLSTMLKQAGGMVGLSSRGELGDAIQHLLAGTNDEMVGVARQVLETHQGANRRTVEWLRIG